MSDEANTYYNALIDERERYEQLQRVAEGMAKELTKLRWELHHHGNAAYCQMDVDADLTLADAALASYQRLKEK